MRFLEAIERETPASLTPILVSIAHGCRVLSGRIDELKEKGRFELPICLIAHELPDSRAACRKNSVARRWGRNLARITVRAGFMNYSV